MPAPTPTTPVPLPHIAGAPRAPTAVVVCGPPGSGKTTLAVALATALRYPIVDLDTVTGPLTTVALELMGEQATDFDSSAARRLRAARYATLLDVAAANLAVGAGAGAGVVIAAPFTTERRDPLAWAALVNRLTQAGAASGVALLYLQVPADVLDARLSTRDATRDRAKLRREPEATGAETLVPDAIALDGTAPTEEQLRVALAALALVPSRC
jgi:predicted kinase